MKKIFMTLILLLIATINSYAYSSKIVNAYAIGIFNKDGKGENVQHLKKTRANYNGKCYSKILILGNVNKYKADVKIGNASGTLYKTLSIYNKEKNKIGEEQTFVHQNVISGYIQVKVNNKLYDSKVFVK